MELNREQIVKALECCSRMGDTENILEDICEDCPLKIESCAPLLPKYALALIKTLTAENERLRERADRHLENLKAVLDERSESNIKADTVREFTERLTTAISAIFNVSTGEKLGAFIWCLELVDHIAKEMEGVK